MKNFWLSILYYFLAYFVVTIIGVLHTVFNIYILHYKSMKDSPGMGEAYERTKPFHPLYNIIVFPIFTWLYFLSTSSLTLETAAVTSLLWGAVTIILDLIGWVLIRHPWSLSFKEFYIDYQPWITLTYLIIFASPFITYGLLSLAHGL